MRIEGSPKGSNFNTERNYVLLPKNLFTDYELKQIVDAFKKRLGISNGIYIRFTSIQKLNFILSKYNVKTLKDKTDKFRIVFSKNNKNIDLITLEEVF